MIADVENCPQCGAILPPDAPAGICPKCALGLALESPGDSEPAATEAQVGAFRPPKVAQLAEHFPQLEILELLGFGGMGAVYKARQPSLDRFVALKILSPEIGKDPAFAERFTREGRALAKLNHPNIVTVYDSGETDGVYFFVMEYVDGVNLREAIQAQKLSPAEALTIVPQICDALQYAHDEGVVHRDIKPENVLLDKRGRVKVADFGLAKLLGQTPADLTLTQTHQVLGTFHYMAPEQIESPTAVDHRADLYSLGVVFYELLTGKLPLGRFPLPSEQAKVDAKLDDVVLRTLEREPERRYQHASAIKTDVESLAKAAAPSVAKPVERASAEPMATAEDWELMKHRVRGPSLALICLGVVNILPLFVVACFAALAVIYRDDPVLNDRFENLRDPSMLLLVSVPFGLIMLLGGISMRQLGSYELARIGAYVGWIPFSPLWILNLWLSIWVVQILGRPEAKVAFEKQWQRTRGNRTDGRASRREWPNPGVLMMGAIMLSIGAAFAFGSSGLLKDGGFWVGLGLMLGSGGLFAGAFAEKSRVPLNAFHPGPAAMGAVMSAVGGFLFLMALLTPPQLDGVFVWIGMGVALGGGGCFCGVWNKKHLEEARVFNPSPLVMGIVMLVVGIVLLALGISGQGDMTNMLVFVGMGITLGGGGCCAGAWAKKKEEQTSEEEVSRTAATARHDSVSNDFWAARDKRHKWAGWLVIFGGIAIVGPIAFVVTGLSTDPLPLDIGYLLLLPAVPIGLVVLLVGLCLRGTTKLASASADDAPPGKEVARPRKNRVWMFVVCAVVLMGVVLLASAGIITFYMTQVRIGFTLNYQAAWHDSSDRSVNDTHQLLKIINRRLEMHQGGRPLGVAQRPDSPGGGFIRVDIYGTDASNMLRARRRIESDGTFALRAMAHPTLDRELIEATSDTDGMVRVAGKLRGRWLRLDPWSKGTFWRTTDVVIRKDDKNNWRVLVLENEGELGIGESHIDNVQAGPLGITARLSDEGAVLWAVFNERDLSGGSGVTRKLGALLGGDIYQAAPDDSAEVVVAMSSLEEQHDWQAILRAGRMPAEMKLMGSGR